MRKRNGKECDQHRSNKGLAGKDKIGQGKFLMCIEKSFKCQVYQWGLASAMTDLFNGCQYQNCMLCPRPLAIKKQLHLFWWSNTELHL